MQCKESSMETHETQLKSHGQLMTDKQIRDVVTPYEFGVADDIIGTRLARPFRRGFALLIDLFLVAMLTHLPSIILAALGVIFFWRAGKTNNTPARFSWLRKILKGISAILLFGILVAVIDSVNEDDDLQNNDGSILKGVQFLEIASVVMRMPAETEQLAGDIEQQRCQAIDCWQEYLTEISDDIGHIPMPPDVVDELTTKLEPIMSETLGDTERETLLQSFRQSLNITTDEFNEESASNKPELDTDTASIAEDAPLTEVTSAIPVHESGTPSLLAWVQGILEDLGIGFGWAALYFTAVTFWMKGQTPGKWLLRLKVIKLDGTTMTLWQSFGRYGGYGAGFATGLLGFAQIFWEPNRQAIQDKISETLVIQLGLSKLDVQAIKNFRDKNAKASDEHRS